MFVYTDEEGQRIIFLRQKCLCYLKRSHIFHARVEKFCFIWKKVSWYTGLWLIALITILFGIFIFFLIFLAFQGKPSAIDSFVIFPIFSLTTVCQLLLFVGLGTMLWIGLRIGNLKIIKVYPWGLLIGYLLAFIFLILVILQGEGIIKAKVWSEKGMLIKSEPIKEKKYFSKQQIIFYTLMGFIILSLVLFTTYFIILSLSLIDKLESDSELY